MSEERPEREPEPRPARRRRRVVREGTAGATGAVGDAVLPRSPDESDVGWGERAEDVEERLRRDVPPHWGRD